MCILYLIIYLIGYFLAYYLIKKNRYEYENDWGSVILTIGYSFLSWVAVSVVLLFLIKLPKPPKWL